MGNLKKYLTESTNFNVNRIVEILGNNLQKLKIQYIVDNAMTSKSTYFTIYHPTIDDETIKVRISDHKQRYDADYSIDPSFESGIDLYIVMEKICKWANVSIPGWVTRQKNEAQRKLDELNKEIKDREDERKLLHSQDGNLTNDQKVKMISDWIKENVPELWKPGKNHRDKRNRAKDLAQKALGIKYYEWFDPYTKEI